MKITPNYSPNHSKNSRSKNTIKFVIIHYTGMQSEIESVERLKNPNTKVSCHYLINRNGLVTQLVKDKFIAWHAGKSKWKKFNNLNNRSIGIELVNKGHEFGYQNFSKKQIKSLINLCLKLKKKYSIKKENFLGHSDIAPLRKSDPGEKFPWKKLSLFNIGQWYRIKNTKIKLNTKNLEKFFFKNLEQLGYRYFKIQKRNFNDRKVIIAFQRHFLPHNVTGNLDKKTYKISLFLAKKYKSS